MQNDFAIEVRDLTRSFRGSGGATIRAVDGLSFHVRRGEIFGLLGPNGAGKSTTVRILTTILRPTSGAARILGYDVVEQPLNVRHNIAVVLQETAVENLLSVRDNLWIYGRLHGMDSHSVQKRMERVLDQFGLVEKRGEKAQDLSLGMRRRLQVAKVFMTDAPLVFLDEATTGMDPLVKRQTLELILQMARDGKTVLLTTQLLAEAEALCDRILIMKEGREAASGDLDSLRSLVTRRFHVAVTFAEAHDEAFEALRNLQPSEMVRYERTAELRFEGEEARILQQLAGISIRWPMDRFEVRGADLEDIFLDLVSRSEQS